MEELDSTVVGKSRAVFTVKRGQRFGLPTHHRLARDQNLTRERDLSQRNPLPCLHDYNCLI